jgi:hypothetical protein
MLSAYYPQRKGEYVYDVTVTKNESVRLSYRYCAHLSNAERVEDGRLEPVKIDVPDTFGPTVTEALRALEVCFDTWRQDHPPKRQ